MMINLNKRITPKPARKKPASRLEDGSKMPLFFGPHHQAISKILEGQKPFGDVRALLAWDFQVRSFAHCLALDNRLFDKERFYRECGGLPTQAEEPK